MNYPTLNRHFTPYELSAIQHDFFGKKARARRQLRKDDRHAKKMERINAGGGFANTIKNVGSSVASVIGNVMGGGAPPLMENAMNRGVSLDIGQTGPTQEDIQRQRSRTTAIVIVAIVIIAVAAFALSRKKKSSK